MRQLGKQVLVMERVARNVLTVNFRPHHSAIHVVQNVVCCYRYCYTYTVPSVLSHCSLGIRKSIWPVKIWVMRCWWGYLSGARCRLFAYAPADATAIPDPHHLLPRFNPDWVFFRTMLCICGTSHGPVSVSVTSRCSTKTAKRRITQTTPHDTRGILVLWCQRSPRNSTGVTPYGGTKCSWCGSK